MSAKPLTLTDLRKAGMITNVQIVAAIDAYVTNSAAGPYLFARGHSIDIAKAVEASREIAKMAARSGPKEKTLRTAVTTAAMSAEVILP